MSQTHSDWLVILSTTPRDTPTPHHDISRYVAHSRLRQDLHCTRVTKIGLIDPDDPTEEDEQFAHGQRQHKLHSRSVGLTDAIYQNALGSN